MNITMTKDAVVAFSKLNGSPPPASPQQAKRARRAIRNALANSRLVEYAADDRKENSKPRIYLKQGFKIMVFDTEKNKLLGVFWSNTDHWKDIGPSPLSCV